jgi:ribosomal protein L30/L7E
VAMAAAEKASTIKHAWSRRPPHIRDCFQLIGLNRISRSVI